MNSISVSKIVQIPISSADFGISRNETLNITEPGTYTFMDNVEFKPSHSMAAIMIKSNDVVLDLDGYGLSQGNLVSGCDGIKICNGFSHILITNGSISKFTQYGITAGDLNGPPVTDLVIGDMKLYGSTNESDIQETSNNNDDICAANMIKRHIRSYIKFKRDLLIVYI